MQMTKELLQQIINSNFKGWLLAGYPKEFKTWQMSTRAVRHILWPAIDFDFIGISKISLCNSKAWVRMSI